MRKFLKIGDVVVIVTILLAWGILLFLPTFNSAEYAVIYVDGKEYGRYSLRNTEKNIVEINTEFGSNTVVIENGRVYVSSTSCDDKVEVNTGSIYKAGQSLVCVPNRVVITIDGNGDADGTSF